MTWVTVAEFATMRGLSLSVAQAVLNAKKGPKIFRQVGIVYLV